MSRFAKPGLVQRLEAMLLPADRDPLDIVLRRSVALLDMLSQAPGVRDLGPERQALGGLRQRSEQTPVADVGARR